jgi:hypothetical protein
MEPDRLNAGRAVGPDCANEVKRSLRSVVALATRGKWGGRGNDDGVRARGRVSQRDSASSPCARLSRAPSTTGGSDFHNGVATLRSRNRMTTKLEQVRRPGARELLIRAARRQPDVAANPDLPVLLAWRAPSRAESIEGLTWRVRNPFIAKIRMLFLHEGREDCKRFTTSAFATSTRAAVVRRCDL